MFTNFTKFNEFNPLDCVNNTNLFTTSKACTTQITETLSKFGYGQKIIFTVIMIAIILFTTIGNLLTIVAVLSGKYLKAVSYLFIASLATADLIVGGIVMPFNMIYTVAYEGKWTYGPIMCDLWQFVDYVGRTASLTNVCTIALDRCMTVSRPLKSIHTRTRKRAIIMILVSWLIPVINWVIFIAVLQTTNGTGKKGGCFFTWKPFYLVITFASLTVYAPILIILVLFTVIFLSLRQHAKRLSRRLRRRSLNTGKSSFEENSTSETFVKSPAFERYSRYCLFNCFQNFSKFNRRPRYHSTYNESYISERISEKTCDMEYEVIGCHNSKRKSVRFRNMATNMSTERKLGRACRSVGEHVDQSGNMSINRGTCRSVGEHASIRSNIYFDVQLHPQLPYPRTRSEPDINSKVRSYDTSGRSLVRRDSSLGDTRPRSVEQDNKQKSLNCQEKVTWRKYAEVRQKYRQDSLEKSRLAQQIRAAKTLTVIMIFILLCWLPFAIIWPVQAYCPECLSQEIFNLSLWINYLNATINPIVYCLCNPTIRRAFRHMIRGR